MKRHTYKVDGIWSINGVNGKLVSDKYANYRGKAIDRLAEYEDMEEQGLLVRLPCKPGDSFFAVRKFCDEYGELEEPVEHWDSDCYGCNLPCNGKLKVVERKFNSIHHIIAEMESIGDSIFLTREEAEKALEDA